MPPIDLKSGSGLDLELPNASAHQIETRLDRCLTAVRMQPDEGFPARPFLLPALEATRGLVAAGALDRLEADRRRGSDGACRLARENIRAVVLPALIDSVNGCLLVLTALEDLGFNNFVSTGNRSGTGSVSDAREILRRDANSSANALLPPETLYWAYIQLRGYAQRLRVLQPLLEIEAAGEVAAAKLAQRPWDPSELFHGGAAQDFWRRHFPGQVAVSAGELLNALGNWYAPLERNEREELMAWLRCSSIDGLISIVDAALVLDGPGVWRSVLFCTAWPELQPEAFLHTVMAGGNDRHTAMTAADLAAEKREKLRSVILPEWSRERLRGDRNALHALRALGAQVVANVKSHKGMLVQFPFEGLAHFIVNSPPSLCKVCRELLGRDRLVANPAQRVSAAKCVAEWIATHCNVESARERHITLGRLHHRKILELRDDSQDVLLLQRQHADLVRGHLLAGGADLPASSETPMAAYLEDGMPPEGEGQVGMLRDLLMLNRSAQDVRQRFTMARVDEEFKRNAGGNADEAVETQMAHLGADAAFAEHEQVVLVELNVACIRQTTTLRDLSQIEQSMVSLETDFAKFRRQLIKKDEDLTRNIVRAEDELAQVMTELAGQRERAREAEDSALDARFELAELMVLLPPGKDTAMKETFLGAHLATNDEAVEVQLMSEIELLKGRVDELEKRYRKAKAAASKQPKRPI
eukprot:TRINITY_DN18449_c0_g2_i2.p1 TRINITY_DN18449_c0_g2~~TRINITY_DN18449_c0_g2_i2.p1  ORF type:complete len:700 (-),score=176.62 TRINITY_DN18449_c0_g2_i2:154-2253(-)